jgi:hypothetical protein
MPGLLYNYKKERMAYPGDPSEEHLRYDGCSLNLLKPPENNCHYVACWGKDNTIECGTYKLCRLKGQDKRVERKKVRQESSNRVGPQLSSDTRIEENAILADDEGVLDDDEDVLVEEEEDMLE